MKLNKYFMIGAMGLSLVACSDNLDDNQGVNGNASNEGSTYAALKIDFGNSSSRATGDLPSGNDQGTTDPTYDDDEAEADNETLIKDVRIVVVDENSNTVENKVVTSVTQNDEKENIYIFQITPGKKTFYAVINGNALGLENELKDWDGGELTLNKKASELCDYNTAPTAGKGFLMSSVAPVAGITIQDDVDETEVKTGKVNNVTITVDRVVAKVTMQVKADIDMSKQTATLKNLTCQIGNADNLKYDKDAAENAKYTLAGTYLRAKNETTGERTYRITPYYTYFLTEDSKEGFEQSNLLSGSASAIYTTNEGGAVTTTQARFYCLENTHDTDNYDQGNTTFVRVKAEMIPNSAKTFTYTAQSGETPESIKIDEKVISADQALETFYVITSAPDQSYQGSYVFESDLVALYGNNGLVSGDAATDSDKAKAVIAALAENNRGYAFTEPYIDGAGYYNIWVNDLKNADGGYLKIAPVFRNDWYDLTIQSIQLPGDPKENIDPEQPIHPDTNMGVVVEIRNWNKVSHGVDLQ